MTSAAILRSPTFAAPERDAEARALFDIIYRLSFGRGDVTLSSGKKSNYYFDMKPSMLDPQGAHLMAKGLLAEVLAVGGEYVGGLEMGAVPITGAICQLSYTAGTPVSGFFVRKKAKEHGAKKLIEGLRANETVRGKRLVVIDDVTTSGASALVAVEACRQEGADVRLVVSVVDRCEGAAEAFADEGIPFKSLFIATDFLSRTD
jgi:orotate phosphoribosyltransferase